MKFSDSNYTCFLALNIGKENSRNNLLSLEQWNRRHSDIMSLAVGLFFVIFYYDFDTPDDSDLISNIRIMKMTQFFPETKQAKLN